MKKYLKNHFGFSLIEMITAFAVLGVASLAIGGFFVSSSRSYASSSSETGLQYEAQMALNQIEGKLIDATLGVNYNLIENENNTSTYHFVESDTFEKEDLQSKVLYIFDSKDSGFEALLVKWDIAKKELLYKEVSLNSFQQSDTVQGIDVKGNLAGTWELLAEGVENFSVDLSKYRETKTVDVTIGLEKRNREFETVGTITLRNNVLVNASNISDIYQNMSGATATRIDGIVLSANTDVTTPGGTVQLSTTVTGVYPSQDIHKWLVAHTYDDLAAVLDNNNLIPQSETYVDGEKILHVSTASLADSTFHQTIYVQAVVNPDTNPVYSNIITINVRDITGLGIWPEADLSAVGNETLTADELATWGSVSTGQINSTPVDIYPSNRIQMRSTISGQYQEDDDVKVIWTIARKGSGVVATINEETGLITVDRNSQKGELQVKATLQGTDYSANYAFAIASPYTENDKVTVIAPTQMNRGQEAYQCEVKLNGATAYASDYNWSVSVETSAGQQVTGNPVEISSTGLLTVKDTLSFDYSYKITVYATMKSDSDRYGAAIVTVPKVTMFLSTTEALTPTIGSTIPAGKIICNVVGLTNYDVNWTIAKETNPTYYFTAYGNTNITGNEVTLYPGSKDERVVKTPKVVIGADEPKTLTYMRVKATLVGHSNYASTLKLVFNETIGEDMPGDSEGTGGNEGSGESGGNQGSGEPGGNQGSGDSGNTGNTSPLPSGRYDNYYLEASNGTVSRNSTISVTANHRGYFQYRPQAVKVDNGSWHITGVYVDGKEVQGHDGLSIVQGETNAILSVSPTFKLEYMDKTVTVKMNATVDGRPFAEDIEVSVNKITLTNITLETGRWDPSNTIERGDERDFTCDLNGISGGMSSELYQAGVRLEWNIQKRSQDNSNKVLDYVSMVGSPKENGKRISVKVSNNIDKDRYFIVNVSLKYNGTQYDAESSSQIKADK